MNNAGFITGIPVYGRECVKLINSRIHSRKWHLQIDVCLDVMTLLIMAVHLMALNIYNWLYTNHVCKFQKSRCNTFFSVELTQDFQNAPEGGCMGRCLVTKINRGRDCTFTDNKCKLRNYSC